MWPVAHGVVVVGGEGLGVAVLGEGEVAPDVGGGRVRLVAADEDGGVPGALAVGADIGPMDLDVERGEDLGDLEEDLLDIVVAVQPDVAGLALERVDGDGRPPGVIHGVLGDRAAIEVDVEVGRAGMRRGEGRDLRDVGVRRRHQPPGLKGLQGHGPAEGAGPPRVAATGGEGGHAETDAIHGVITLRTGEDPGAGAGDRPARTLAHRAAPLLLIKGRLPEAIDPSTSIKRSLQGSTYQELGPCPDFLVRCSWDTLKT